MLFKIHSYRYAQEIIEHRSHKHALKEILPVIGQCPLFLYPNKSSKNLKLDVVQQLFNTFFDRRLACDHNWQYHPSATEIPDSGLAADYRKEFGKLRIQAEVQFGNMARWYTDIFKFQTAYSQDLIDIGLCIVPMAEIAKRMDSNVTYFERCIRELPSAKLSITLPILIIGLYIDNLTPIINVAQTNFGSIKSIVGKGNSKNKYRIVHGYLSGAAMHTVNENSEPGPMPTLFDESEFQ